MLSHLIAFLVVSRIYSYILLSSKSSTGFGKRNVFTERADIIYYVRWKFHCLNTLVSHSAVPPVPSFLLSSPFPSWHAVRSYWPHLEVRDPIWGDDLSHSLYRRSPIWGFLGFFLSSPFLTWCAILPTSFGGKGPHLERWLVAQTSSTVS